MPDFIGLCSPVSPEAVSNAVVEAGGLGEHMPGLCHCTHQAHLALTKGDTWKCAGIVVRNMLVTYDRFNQQIGFFKTNCTDLWSILPADAPISPPPAAPPANEQAPPVESPTAPPLSTPSPAPLPEGMYLRLHTLVNLE